jgi:signal transduction histidine kinase
VNDKDTLHEQLDSLHAISVEIAALRDMNQIHDRTLEYCIELTGSKFAFTGLLTDGSSRMDVAAIRGFEPVSQDFYEKFHLMIVRSSVFGVTLVEHRPTISNDVANDPNSVGTPPGHPPVATFMGVPLLVGDNLIGMIGVANKADGYDANDQRLLQTFANQVAVAIDNARLYESQREMIAGLQVLHERLNAAEREHVLARERERIAEGLHDRIGQDIFTIGLRLNTLIDDASDDTISHELLRLRQLSIQAADEIRRVIFALAKPGGPHGDLTSAVRALLAHAEASYGIQTELAVAGSPSQSDVETNDVIYGIVREAITNIGHHAKANNAMVSLRFSPSTIHVVILDDGLGMPAKVLSDFEGSYLHFGLRHMREQVLSRGGTMEVTNGEETGATIRIVLPVGKEP